MFRNYSVDLRKPCLVQNKPTMWPPPLTELVVSLLLVQVATVVIHQSPFIVVRIMPHGRTPLKNCQIMLQLCHNHSKMTKPLFWIVFKPIWAMFWHKHCLKRNLAIKHYWPIKSRKSQRKCCPSTQQA